MAFCIQAVVTKRVAQLLSPFAAGTFVQVRAPLANLSEMVPEYAANNYWHFGLRFS